MAYLMLRRLKNLFHLLKALFAVLYFRYPAKNLRVIGVTGTDGKTTTVNLIYSILKEAGFSAAMVSTVSAKIGDEEIDTGFHVTTPDSWLLQKLLRKMASQGVKYVILEATSHGLDQHRLFGCNFEIGAVTNVTHEHLDYHETYGNYLAAKARLLGGIKVAILNRDDKSYEYLNAKCQMSDIRCITYGIRNQADFTPKCFKFKTRLLGEYNQYNCLVAIAVAKSLRIADEVIKKALADFSGVSGRMEEISEGQNFRVIVDFAHTPAAFEAVLSALRGRVKGGIIHVFGCTGERDKSKRPMMGEISAHLADKIILTCEDTYHEDPERIIKEIGVGVKSGGKVLDKDYWIMTDREEAIGRAIKMAKRDDCVLVTGVGHQRTLNLGGRETPWSDQETCRRFLKERVS